MTWPVDKLALISEQLAMTGNNVPAAADDGSVEWTVCSAAYEQAFEYALDGADWKQCTTVVTLQSTGVAPTDDQFDTAYAKPSDCVHVVWVRINDLPVVWQILGNQIVLNATGIAPGMTLPTGTTPGVCTMKYVSSSNAATNMLRTFMTALGRFVMAGIYRGMHKDFAAARSEEQSAMRLLQEARTRSDQEQPKRAAFNSRISAARRVRRPWPVVPTGWGGTGTPG